MPHGNHHVYNSKVNNIKKTVFSFYWTFKAPPPIPVTRVSNGKGGWADLIL